MRGFETLDAKEIGSILKQQDQTAVLYRLKLSIYMIFYKLIKTYLCSQLIHIFIIVLETFQFLAFPFYMDSSVGEFRRYTNWLYISTNATTDNMLMLFLIDIFVSIAYVLSFIVLLVNACCFSKNLKKPNDSFKCFFQVYGMLIVILQHLLVLPITEIFFILYSGKNSSDRTSSEVIVMSVTASICLVLVFTLVIVSIMFFHEEQFNSSLPWTMNPLLVDFLKLLKKIVIAFNVAFDFSFQVKCYSLVAIFLIFTLELYLYIKSNKMDKKWVFIATICCEVICWLTCIVAISRTMISNNLLDYIAFILLLTPTVVVSIIAIRWRRHIWLLSRSLIELNTTSRIEEYLRNLLTLIDNKDKLSDYAALMGFVKQHTLNCFNIQCTCRFIDIPIEKRGGSLGEGYNNLEEFMNDTRLSDFVYNLAEYFIQDAINRIGKQSKLYILSANLQFVLLNNKFQSLYDLQQAAEFAPSIYEDFLIYRFHCQIEQTIIAEENKESISGSNSISNIISFQERFIIFRDLITSTTNIYLKFWKELLKDTTGYRELTDFGYQIATNLDNMNSIFDHLAAASHNSIKAYVLFTLFLSKVANDAISANEKYNNTMLLMNTYQINKKGLDSASERYGGNSNATIVIISGNKSNLGVIKNANHELYDMLGFEKKDTMKNNITIFMPEIIGAHHNKFIQKYFAKSTSITAVTAEKVVLAQNIKGYLVPCNILLKLLPNLSDGIKLISFMINAEFIDEFRPGDEKTTNDEVILFLLDQDGRIHGFNKKFVNMLGSDQETMNIYKYLQNDQKFNLHAIYPDLFVQDNIDHMKTPEGFETMINLLTIIEIFQAEICEFSNKEEEKFSQKKSGDTTENLFRTTAVNIKFKEFRYLGDSLVYSVCTMLLEKEASNNFAPNQNGHDSNKDYENDNRLRKELALIEDDAASQTTSSSCSASQGEMRLIHDFRIHIRERKDPRTIFYFRIASYVLLIALIVLTSVIYWMKTTLNTNFTNAFELTLGNYDFFHTAFTLAFSARTIRNIYLKIEPESSNIINDRTTFYMSNILEHADEMIEAQRLIDEHHDFDLFYGVYEKFYNPGVQIYDIDAWDGDVVVKEGDKRYISMSVAARQIPAKAIAITQVNMTQYKNRNIADFASWDREIANVLINCKRSLRLIGEETTTKFPGLISDYASNQKRTYLIIVLSSAGGIILAMLMLIPLIIKAHSHVANIYRIFIRIKKEDYNELVNVAEEYLTLTEKHYTDIKRKFNDTNFKEIQRQENDAILEAAKNNRQRAKPEEKKSLTLNGLKPGDKNKDKPNDAQNVDEDEKLQENENEAEDILTKRLEAIELQRKEKSMNEASSSFRNILLSQIIFMAFVFVIYFIVTILIRLQYFSNVEKVLLIVKIIAKKESLMAGIMLFAKEDFFTGTIDYDITNKTQQLFEYYFREMQNNELDRQLIIEDVANIMEDLNTVIERSNSREYCDIIPALPSTINNCKTSFNSIMMQGLEGALNEMLRKINLAHHELENYIRMNKNMSSAFMKDSDLMNCLDMNEGYITYGTGVEFSELLDHSDKIFNMISSFDTYDFIILLLLLVFVITIAFRLFLNRFEFSLWKTKRMLGILPTRYMATQFGDIKKIISQIS